jgi:hypothetical protein
MPSLGGLGPGEAEPSVIQAGRPEREESGSGPRHPHRSVPASVRPRGMLLWRDNKMSTRLDGAQLGGGLITGKRQSGQDAALLLHLSLCRCQTACCRHFRPRVEEELMQSRLVGGNANPRFRHRPSKQTLAAGIDDMARRWIGRAQASTRDFAFWPWLE